MIKNLNYITKTIVKGLLQCHVQSMILHLVQYMLDELKIYYFV